MARTSSDLYNPGGKRASRYPNYPLDTVLYYWDDIRVANKIDSNDFAALIYDGDSDRYGLRQGELVPILWKAVQELSARVEALEAT